jgi:hypothetical protein
VPQLCVPAALHNECIADAVAVLQQPSSSSCLLTTRATAPSTPIFPTTILVATHRATLVNSTCGSLRGSRHALPDNKSHRSDDPRLEGRTSTTTTMAAFSNRTAYVLYPQWPRFPDLKVHSSSVYLQGVSRDWISPRWAVVVVSSTCELIDCDCDCVVCSQSWQPNVLHE